MRGSRNQLLGHSVNHSNCTETKLSDLTQDQNISLEQELGSSGKQN